MPHALLIDDDAGLRCLLTNCLRYDGMHVTAVVNAASLCTELSEGKFDVLQPDLMLPDADGLDLSRWVRKRHGPPVFILAGPGDPESLSCFNLSSRR